jgi:hypothetical protein
MTTAIFNRQKGFGHMTRLAQQLVAGLATAHKAAHEEPDPQQQPSAEEVEASGIAALGAALYGTPSPPTATEEQPS